MEPKQTRTGLHVGYWLIAVAVVLGLQFMWAARSLEPVPYSQFEKYLAEGKIAEVVVSDRQVLGKLKQPEGKKTAIVAARVEPQTAEYFAKFNVPYERTVENTFLRDVVSWVAPALVFFAVWFFLVRRFADRQGFGGLVSIGKSRAKVYMETSTGVTFDTWPAWTRRSRSCARSSTS